MSTLTDQELRDAKRAAWLEARRKVVTSTDVSILFGEGYSGSSPSLLYAQKKGLAPETQSTEKMEWGLLLEDDIAEMYRRSTGVPVRLTDPFELVYWDGDNRFASSLDGFDAEGMLLEIKNTELWIQGEDDLFMGWRIQAQWQMLCTNQQKCRIVACVRGSKLVTIDLTVDYDFLEVAKGKALEFLGYLESNTPPPVRFAEDNLAMKYLHVAEPGLTVEIKDQDIENVLEERAEALEQKRKLEERLSLLDATTKDYLRGAEVGLLPNGGKVTWKADKNGKRSIRHYKPKG